MTVLYAESWRAIFNTLRPEVQEMVLRAKEIDSFYPPEVKDFVRRVIENAERIAAAPLPKIKPKQLADKVP